MSFSPAPLYSLCLHRISGRLKQLTDVYRLGLPIRVRNNILCIFEQNRENRYIESLRCYETPEWLSTNSASPHDKRFLDSMREHCLDMWDWTTPTPFPPDVYAFLMQLPPNYVSFFLEDPTHFIIRRFIKEPIDAPQYCLCEPCFNRDMDYDRSVYWLEKTHSVWPMREALRFIHDSHNWCANCVTTPLFELLSEQMCRQKHNLHHRVRRSQMFWHNHNYDTDDDSDSDDFITFRVQHPKLTVTA